MAGPDQRRFAQGGGQVTDRFVNDATRVPGRTVLIALLLAGAGTGAAAQEPKPVPYTCADGTKLQATFSPPSTSMGSVKLVYAGSAVETTLPQAISADGGRYTHGDVEFWIKGTGATLTRAGQATTCRSSR
jgi:membrane-bound inhibitor of C-type lysozyme